MKRAGMKRAGMKRDAFERRRRLVSGLRLVAAVAWLTLALLVFRVPLARVVLPVTRAAGIGGVFPSSASGFLLRVRSEPPGARLRVDGVDRGIAPLFTNVACVEGQVVRLRVVWDDPPPWEREVGCREGRTLTIHARLENADHSSRTPQNR